MEGGWGSESGKKVSRIIEWPLKHTRIVSQNILSKFKVCYSRTINPSTNIIKVVIKFQLRYKLLVE